jgi:hypothetical protein
MTGQRILLCSELIDAVLDMALDFDEELDQRFGAMGPIRSIVFHELGHALIDALDLPALGREEDVADQLASLLMSDEPILAMTAANFWESTGSGEVPSLEEFADTHSFNLQRYYNMMCWAYGADPSVRAYVLGYSELPPERAERCGDEYDQMRSAWEQLLEPYLSNTLGLSAIRPSRNSSGQWDFVEFMGNGPRALCEGSGTLTLYQANNEFFGWMAKTAECTESELINGVFDLTDPDSFVDVPLEEGVVSGNVLGFDVGPCRYTAALEQSGYDRMEGQVTCGNLSGSWSAER